jgi:hypothetical protein
VRIDVAAAMPGARLGIEQVPDRLLRPMEGVPVLLLQLGVGQQRSISISSD